MNEPLPDLLRRAAELGRSGRAVMGCLLVKARGSTPQGAGALMLVDEAANTFGTIGGGCVEAEVRRCAHGMLGGGESGVMRFKLDHDYGWDDGLLCGGTFDLAVGPMPPVATLEAILDDIVSRRPASLPMIVDTDDGPVWYGLRLPVRERLYVVGAGHVGQAVARLALRLDFDVTIFDDRGDLLERALPAGATGVGGLITETLAAAPIDGDTYVAIVTRGHRHDAQALAAVVGRGARYVGMIGSRRKIKVINDDLVERGVAATDLEAVHAPIGLDIGATSVEEIGLAIAGQLVAVRRTEAPPVIDGPVPVESDPVGAGG